MRELGEGEGRKHTLLSSGKERDKFHAVRFFHAFPVFVYTLSPANVAALTSGVVRHVSLARSDKDNDSDDHEDGGDEVAESEADVLLDVHHDGESDSRAQVDEQVEPAGSANVGGAWYGVCGLQRTHSETCHRPSSFARHDRRRFRFMRSHRTVKPIQFIQSGL